MCVRAHGTRTYKYAHKWHRSLIIVWVQIDSIYNFILYLFWYNFLSLLFCFLLLYHLNGKDITICYLTCVCVISSHFYLIQKMILIEGLGPKSGIWVLSPGSWIEELDNSEEANYLRFKKNIELVYPVLLQHNLPSLSFSFFLFPS